MAIKISGTTVINDSRNIENINGITANTANVVTFSANTITADSFVGDGSQLSGIGGSKFYAFFTQY